jgi:hypothetical protein
MPSSSAAEEKPKKRAVRKRTPRRTASKDTPQKAAVKKAVRRRAPRKRVVAPAPEITKPDPTVAETTARKAPTPIAARKASSRARKKQFIVASIIFLTGVGASAAVGFTDQGTIDVNEMIEARNERLRSGQMSESDTQRVIVPVQNTSIEQLPNGGLVGLGVGAEPPAPAPEPEPEVSTSTATSSEAVATSTESVSEETELDETAEAIPEETATGVEEAPESGPPTLEATEEASL